MSFPLLLTMKNGIIPCKIHHSRCSGLGHATQIWYLGVWHISSWQVQEGFPDLPTRQVVRPSCERCPPRASCLQRQRDFDGQIVLIPQFTTFSS